MKLYGVISRSAKRGNLRGVAIFSSKSDALMFVRAKEKGRWLRRGPFPTYDVELMTGRKAQRLLEGE